MAPPLLKVVVLEEEQGMCSAHVKNLQGAGMEAYGANSVSAAIKTIGEHSINVLLVEFNEKNIAELKFVSDLISSKSNKIKVFMLTSWPYPQGLGKFSEHSSVKILTKPLTFQEIISSLRINWPQLVPRVQYEGQIYEAVTSAMKEVLGAYISSPIGIHAGQTKKGYKVSGPFASLIRLSSDKFLGTLAITLNNESVAILVKAMLGDEDLSKFSQSDLESVVGELINQVSGILSKKLREKGFTINVATPKSAYGPNLQIFHPGANKVGVIQFELGAKSFLKNLFEKDRASVEFCFDDVG